MLQEKAFAILKSGKNVFLTGSAGTGKTHVLNQYIKYLKERKVQVATTASTGIAATHMNGMTIHSWAGIGIKDHITRANLLNMKTKKYLKKHLESAKVLIIDEISMLHKNQLEAVNVVLKFFKNSPRAFGGIQVVFSGDFFQLPPIGKQGETSRDKFSFMSKAWLEAGLTICYLTEQYRQSDNELNRILNEIREQRFTQNSYDQLKKTAENQLDQSVEPTKLFTHNLDVDTINVSYLDKIGGSSKKYKARTKGNIKLIETLKNSVLAGENLELKSGAKVMFVRNNPEKGYVNGSLGKILNFNDEGIPIVELFNGKIVSAEEETWAIQDDSSRVLASYYQIPLRLAWAITVHKCQGMTLDAAEIDLSKTFEKGQGYVALSRLKKLENLRLSGINEMAFEVDELALRADNRFRELSNESDNNLSIKELDSISRAFIVSCGGLRNPKEIRKNKQKIREKKTGKQSTYAITLGYLKQKISLKKIAIERGLTFGTIAGHLAKISAIFPDEDLSFYKPKQSIIKKVAKAYRNLSKEQTPGLKVIFDELNGKVSYTDIKLALAFI